MNHPTPIVRSVGWLLVIASALLAGACGGSDDAAEPDDSSRGHVGTVEGTGAFVAVVSGDDEAVVYVCSDDEDIAVWFAGPIGDDGTIALTNAAGSEVAATTEGDRVDGTITFADGTTHDFSAQPVGDGAGLFRVTGDEAKTAEVVAGWIVDGEGEQRGSLRVRGTKRPAPDLPADGLVVDGRRLPISVFTISPAAPSPVPVPYPNIAKDEPTTTKPTPTTSG